MLAIRKTLSSGIRIPLLSAVILVGALAALGQAGKQPSPPAETDAQRAQRFDQAQQQQDQSRQGVALRHPQNDIEQQQARLADEARQRALLGQMMRENFRRHYRILRTNAEEVVKLTAELQTSIDKNQDAVLSREMLARTARIQKLAHEIRNTLAGQKLSKEQVVKEKDTKATPLAATLDCRPWLVQRISESSDLAATLQASIERHLAAENEQVVSVDALKRAGDKTQLDPQLVSIMLTSMKLEHLAASIHAKRCTASIAAIPK